MGLRWTNEYCANTDYALLADDDVFLNIPLIVREYAVRSAYKNDVLHCGYWLAKHAKVLRKGKWGVSRQLYNMAVYPSYCLGPAYIMSQDVARELYVTSEHTRTDMFIDDVFISGVLR
uniref:Hexosyltransferase n=1 Tax=Ciona savignyi TaxID=51511 RepID=H2YJZ4_CIOSA